LNQVPGNRSGNESNLVVLVSVFEIHDGKIFADVPETSLGFPHDACAQEVRTDFKRFEIIQENDHSQTPVLRCRQVEKCRFDSPHRVGQSKASLVPKPQSFHSEIIKTTIEGVGADSSQCLSDVTGPTAGFEFKIMNHRLVCPDRTIFSRPEHQVAAQRKRTLFPDGKIGGIEIIPWIQIHRTKRPHPEIPVLLENHHVRFDATRKRFHQIQVKPNHGPGGHAPSLHRIPRLRYTESMRIVFLTLLVLPPSISILLLEYSGRRIRGFLRETAILRDPEDMIKFKNLAARQMYLSLFQGLILLIPPVAFFFGIRQKLLLPSDFFWILFPMICVILISSRFRKIEKGVREIPAASREYSEIRDRIVRCWRFSALPNWKNE